MRIRYREATSGCHSSCHPVSRDHRSHHDGHSHQCRADLLNLLYDLHWSLLHTCVHSKETICGERCIDHVRDEINEILWEIKDVGSDLSDIEHDHPSLANIKVVDHIDNTLDDMCKEIDSLDIRLRKFLHENRRAQEIHYSNVESVIASSCAAIKKHYNDLIREIMELDIFDKETINELYL